MAVIGASWKASVPMDPVGTCPQMTTMGTESAMQSRTGVTQFVAPGPDVTSHHAHAAACARIAGGHEARPLLVRWDDERHRFVATHAVLSVVAEDGVVGRENRASAVPEHSLDALVREHLHENLGAAHHPAGERMRPNWPPFSL